MASYDTSSFADWPLGSVPFARRFATKQVDGPPVYPKAIGVVPVAAGFRRDPLGICHLKGHIKGGHVGSQAFTLPVYYRPGEDLIFEVHSEDDTSSVPGSAVRVLANGAVVPSSGGNALVSLDGISFRVG